MEKSRPEVGFLAFQYLHFACRSWNINATNTFNSKKNTRLKIFSVNAIA